MEGEERKLPPPIRPPLAAQLGSDHATRSAMVSTGKANQLRQRFKSRREGSAKAPMQVAKI